MPRRFKLLIALSLFIAISAHAQTRCTVTGNLQSLTGGAIQQGLIIFQLSNIGIGNPVTIPSTSIIPNLSYTVQSAGDGSFTIGIWGNDVISPSNTVYSVTYRDSSGNLVGPILYSITGASFNLNSATALNGTTPPVLGISASLSANNAWTGPNSFTGTPGPFYVATAGNGGSDSADCLASATGGGHGPCLTPQHAVNVALAYNFGAQGTFININIGTGTFQAPTISGHIAGSGSFRQTGTQLVLNGNGSGNTTLNDPAAQGFAVEISDWIPVQIQNLTITASNGEYGLFVQNFAILQIGADVKIGCASGTCSTAIHAEEFGQIEHLSGTFTMTISGAWNNIITLGTSGSFQTNNTITCNSFTYTNAFIFADQESEAQFFSPFALSGCGAITGTRYIIRGNSIVSNYGPGPALPGNAIGLVQAGGRYEPSSVPTSASVTACTGGSAVAQVGSGSHGGSIVVTTGTGCASPNGGVTFNWTEYQSPGSGTLGCTASNANGASSAWVNGATTSTSVSSTQITINFTNAATNLVSSSSYQLLYVCGVDF